MSQRKRVGVGVAVVAVLAAVLLWRCHGSNSRSSDAANAKDTAAKTGPNLGTIGKEIQKRPDPKTVARGSIAGTVRDEAKAPIAGARVCVDPSSQLLEVDLVRDPICKETDAQGQYKIDQLYAARYAATAGAKTYRPETFHPKGDRHRSGFELAAGEAKTGVDFVLRAGGVEITGTVSDISGGPIAHAQVRASSGMWGNGPEAPMVETDDKGAYSVWLVPGNARVRAGADGYASSTAMGRAPGKIDLLLTPESGLSGTVVDGATGKPIEGADVSVDATQWSWDGSESDKSDAQGKFKVHRLPPGRYVVKAHDDHGYGRTDSSVLVGLGQQVDGVVVKLYPASRIVAKVMIDGAPPTLCAEPWASLRDEVHDRWVQGTTEPDGTVHMDGVLPGRYTPQVWCEGYRAADHYPPVVVDGKDIVDLTWTVSGGATVRGRVLTKSGQPIEDAEVQAQTTGGDVRAKTDWSGDRTTADGSYELRGLKQSAYKLDVQTQKAVAPRDSYKVDVPATGTVTKDLIMEDGGTIKGVVVDEQAKPVDGININARPLADRFWWGGMNQIKSASDGTFTVDALRPGDYRVTAQRSWSDELRKPGTNDDAEQGEKTTVEIGKVATVKLVVETQSGTIKGSVVDANGQPVSDAFIASARESDAAGAQQSSAQGTRGWGWGDEDKPVLTNPDGAFTVTKLSPGKYTLRAYRKGGGEAFAEHVAVGSTAKLQIKHTGSIEGTAKKDGGPLADELSVHIADLKTGFDRSEEFYRTNGHFIIHDLPAGHFAVTVSAEGGQKKIDVDLTEGEEKASVDVTLEELVTLTGRVVDMVTKQPVPGLMVFAQPAQSGNGFTFNGGWGNEDLDNITDVAGKFTVKRAPKGKLAIQGMAKEWKESDYSWFRVLKTVTESGTVDVGDITVIKKRIKEGETAGKLGIHFKEEPPDQAPELATLEVSFVEPTGPAAKLDIKVGDLITSIDGVDVTGGNAMHAWTLMNAPVGTKLTLGLKRGTQISVTLAPP